MAFLLGSANSARGGYDIDNSLRFNNDDSTLIKSFDAAGNRRTFTVSTWVKLGDLASGKITGTQTGGNNYFFIGNKDNGQFTIQQGDNGIRVATVALNRDPSAWYHTVFAFDTTQGTDTNRVKIYVNGVLADVCRPEAFTTAADYPSQNLELFHNMTTAFGVGCRGDGDNPLEGSLSEFYFIDGTQYAASNFGEFNDNGVWIPKKAKDDLTFGTNGFYLEFKQTGTSQNSSGIGADTSGNDNHFAVANLGVLDVITDTPTNNFATLMLTKDITLTEGNLIMSHNREYWDGAHATIGLTSGKWYWEHRIDDADGDDRRIVGGIVSNPETYPHIYDGKGNTGDPAASGTYGTVSSASPSYMYTSWATNLIFDGTDTYNNNFVDIDDDDVLSFALDLDNNKFFIAVNGSYIAGDDGGTDGDPAAGTNETFDIVAASASRVYFPAAVVGWGTNTSSTTASFNFGNSSFAISSGNADTNGIGNFEYAVPDGFYSICTKNLAKYGG